MRVSAGGVPAAARAALGEPPAATWRGVAVAYGGEAVLEDVALDVAQGEFVGLVGPNGGGKSTLLRALLGLAPLAAGEVRLFGEPPARFRAWPRVGYVPQHAVHVDAQFPVTAGEVALLGRVGRRGLLRRLRAEDRAAAHRALEEVGVADLAERRVGELSGGQRQRVLLAKALAGEPDLLILDEPTTGVDPGSRERFYQLLDHLNHEHNLTILLVSHDTQAVALSAHRLVALNRQVVYDGPPEGFEAGGGYAAAYGIRLDHDHRGD